MNIDWNSISKRLDEEINRSYELIEGLLNGDSANIEVVHWWNFLSTISNIPTNRLKQEVKRIKEKGGDKDKIEIEYCKLLKIEEPLVHHWTGPPDNIRGVRAVPTEYDTVTGVFRWLYIYEDQNNEIRNLPGLKLSTVKNYLKQGKIEVKRLFKHASFTTSVRDGTPEKWSDELIEVEPELAYG